MSKVYATKGDVLNLARTIAEDFAAAHPQGTTREETQRGIVQAAEEHVDSSGETLLEQAFYAGVELATSHNRGPLDYYGLRGRFSDETMVPENPMYQHAVACCYLAVMAFEQYKKDLTIPSSCS